jgi:hypothetical protein
MMLQFINYEFAKKYNFIVVEKFMYEILTVIDNCPSSVTQLIYELKLQLIIN